MIINSWTEPGVLYTRYLGFVSGEELLEDTLIVSGDARWEDLQYVIGDWSQVEQTDISADQIKQMIACLKPASRFCPSAINLAIVKQNNTGTALAAWYRYAGESLPWQIEIFNDPAAAFSAFNLPESLLHSANT